MKTNVAGVLLAGCLFAVANAALGAVDPDPAAKKIFEKAIAAIQANDRDAFIASGTDTVKEGVTKEVMDGLAKTLGSRLKNGYTASYLCELKQVGHQVHLWKLAFKDGGDDVVVRIAMKDGKVGGFFLQ